MTILLLTPFKCQRGLHTINIHMCLYFAMKIKKKITKFMHQLVVRYKYYKKTR
jgi:hypothetical protein